MDNLIQFQNLNEFNTITHGYTTRLNGVSEGCFYSQNMGFNRGDLEGNVYENYIRVAKSLGLTLDQFVLSDQVHSDEIMVVDQRHRGMGITCESQIKGVDGLITNVSGVALTTFYADCVPLFLYDSVQQVIGMSHSGWRGTAKKIGPKTLKKMGDIYGTKPEHVYVGIGPAIGSCCYEVSEDVKKEFDLSFNDDIIAKIMSATAEPKKYMLDLTLANQILFEEAGVPQHHIEVSTLCTSCHEELFFSHRRMGKERGSHVGIIALK